MQTMTIGKTEFLLKAKFDSGMTYQEFRSWVDALAIAGKTSGNEQKESLIDYTSLNNRRMKRWDKTFKIPEHLIARIQNIDKKMNWLVLTESWCGDAAPSLPVMNKIAELNPNIQLRILPRDENLELMDEFRTSGSLSIPKLIATDESSGQIIGEWGPRPARARIMVESFKEENGQLTAEFREELQRWYNKDKGEDILNDLIKLLALK